MAFRTLSSVLRAPGPFGLPSTAPNVGPGPFGLPSVAPHPAMLTGDMFDEGNNYQASTKENMFFYSNTSTVHEYSFIKRPGHVSTEDPRQYQIVFAERETPFDKVKLMTNPIISLSELNRLLREDALSPEPAYRTLNDIIGRWNLLGAVDVDKPVDDASRKVTRAKCMLNVVVAKRAKTWDYWSRNRYGNKLNITQKDMSLWFLVKKIPVDDAAYARYKRLQQMREEMAGQTLKKSKPAHAHSRFEIDEDTDSKFEMDQDTDSKFEMDQDIDSKLEMDEDETLSLEKPRTDRNPYAPVRPTLLPNFASYYPVPQRTPPVTNGSEETKQETQGEEEEEEESTPTYFASQSARTPSETKERKEKEQKIQEDAPIPTYRMADPSAPDDTVLVTGARHKRSRRSRDEEEEEEDDEQKNHGDLLGDDFEKVPMCWAFVPYVTDGRMYPPEREYESILENWVGCYIWVGTSSWLHSGVATNLSDQGDNWTNKLVFPKYAGEGFDRASQLRQIDIFIGA